MKRILAVLSVVALILVLVAANATTYTVYVATPTQTVQSASTDTGYTSAVYTVTMASTTVSNILAVLPDDNYQKVSYSLTDGTGYINGSVSTPTAGIPLVVGDLHTIDLPPMPKSRGARINVIPASTGTIKVILYKTKP